MNITIKRDAWRKLWYWINKAPGEISGLGIGTLTGDTFTVTDVVLVTQENSRSSTDIEPEHLTKAMYELRESPGEIRWWWHSHDTMGVFWSGTDTQTIQDLGAGGWFLASVFNKKGEHKTKMVAKYANDTFGTKLLEYDDLTFTVEPEQIDSALSTALDEEYQAKCQPKKWKSPVTSGVVTHYLDGHGEAEDWTSWRERCGLGKDSLLTSDDAGNDRPPLKTMSIAGANRNDALKLLLRRDEVEIELNDIDEMLDIYEVLNLITDEERRTGVAATNL